MADDGDQSAKPEPKSIGEWIGDYLGVRLPRMPQIAKSVGKLGAALLDVPTAALEVKAKKTRGDGDRRERFDNALAKAYEQRLGKAAPEEVARLLDGMVHEHLTKRDNRMRVLDLTANELKQDPPKEDAKEQISDDLLAFAKSKIDALGTEEARVLFAKVLAGEIKQPGSFSKKALSVLAEMDQHSGRLFERLCNLSFDLRPHTDDVLVMASGMGDPTTNSLAAFGLRYADLCDLDNSGLVNPNFNAGYPLEPDFRIPMENAGRHFLLSSKIDPNSGKGTPFRLHGVFLTPSGRQLKRIVALQPNAPYLTRIMDAVSGLGWTLTPVD